MKEVLNNYFRIDEKGSSVKRELMGGLVSYLSMSYVIFVNPIF